MRHALLLFLCATNLAAGTSGEIPADFRFQVEVLATGLSQPMHLARLDDGRIFISEIAGKVRVFFPLTKQIQEVGNMEVTTANEMGLLGMALDPDFGQNGWIYLLHSPPDYPGHILSRFTIKDNKMDMASHKEVLRWEVQRQECCHHGGTLRFGPDGSLYISTGDNTNPFGESDSYAPLDERPGRGPWDAQKSSGNTNDLRGKILRIKPTPEGGYDVPTGNLFPKGTPLTRPEIYAMGLRNPWRFDVDANTGFLYVGDVGPDAGGRSEGRGPSGFDTVNQMRRAGNYGWPFVRGNEPYHEFDFATRTSGAIYDSKKPANTSPNNTGAKELPSVQEPLVWYPYDETPKFPLLGSGGRTACAGPVFHFEPRFEKSGGFPAYFDNCVLIYDWQRPFMHWIRLDEESRYSEMFAFTAAVRIAQGGDDGSGRLQIKRPVDMSFGSDGALYLLDYGETWGPNADSKLLRISYQWGNLTPVAKAVANVTAGREPLHLKFSSQGSSDRDGDPLTYEWRLHPGGKTLGTQADLDTTLRETGAYTVELLVSDGKGGTGSAHVPVTVGNTPPEVIFDFPKNGDFFSPGKPVLWQVTVRDAEEGSSADNATSFALRTLVTTTWQKGGKADLPPGLVMMKQSDCFNCHLQEQKLVGPAFQEIADKYRGQAGAADVSVGRIRNGSSNVWGPVPMLPHPQHTADEVHQMVQYIFSLERGNNGSSFTRALLGESLPASDGDMASGVLEASFTDAGRDRVSSLTGRARVTLRSRRMQAEAATEIHGSRVLDFTNASGKKGVGCIGHQHHLQFTDIPLGASSKITCRTASASSGGIIEVRAGKKDGELLTSLEIKPSGGWDSWTETSAILPPAKGHRDVWLVFVKPGVGDGIMNIDWIEFGEN